MQHAGTAALRASGLGRRRTTAGAATGRPDGAHPPPSPAYWLATANGGVYSFGGATFYGSAGNIALVKPIVGMAATPDEQGYWLVASDGGIFTFGDATVRRFDRGA